MSSKWSFSLVFNYNHPYQDTIISKNNNPWLPSNRFLYHLPPPSFCVDVTAWRHRSEWRSELQQYDARTRLVYTHIVPGVLYTHCWRNSAKSTWVHPGLSVSKMKLYSVLVIIRSPNISEAHTQNFSLSLTTMSTYSQGSSFFLIPVH